jgi:LysR family transcriptional regulator, benzoate and cis,cis-muconate-responsive activator of ben and cat genes
VQALEKELRVDLFDRAHRRVQLTEAGKVFLEGATRLLAQADQLVEATRRAARGETGRLIVAFVGSAMYGPFPTALRTFRDRFPGVDLVLDETETTVQHRALLEGRIDVGLLRAPFNDPELVAETLLREPIIVALPQRHGLTRRSEVKLGELASEPFIFFPRGSQPSYADGVWNACVAAGFRPRIVQEAIEMQTAIGLVAAGFGVCLVPAAVSGLRRVGVAYRPLASPAPSTVLVATYRRDNLSPVLREFLHTVRTESARGADAG